MTDARNPVRRRHADRQPRRREPARDRNPARAPTSSPARTRAPRARCSRATASTTRTVALHEHNERRAARRRWSRAARRKEHRAGQRRRHAGALGPGRLAGARGAPRRHPREPAARARARRPPRSRSPASPPPRFLFAGFLPATRSARRKALEALDVPWPVVLYEAPHRIAETLADLAERFGAARELVICARAHQEVRGSRAPAARRGGRLARRARRAQPGRIRAGARARRRAAAGAAALDADAVLGSCWKRWRRARRRSSPRASPVRRRTSSTARRSSSAK